MADSFAWHLGLAAGALTLLAGCKKGPYVAPHASIVGEALAVNVMVVGTTDVTLGKQTKRFDREETFYLPLDDFPAGRHELPIVAVGPDGGKTQSQVAFFAPHRAAGKPWFRVVACGGTEANDASSPGRPVLRSEVGRTGVCSGKGDVKVRAVTMPGATVTVLGKTSTADAAGEVLVPIPMNELHLAATTEPSAEKSLILANPYGSVAIRIAKDGQSMDATLRFAKNGPSVTAAPPSKVAVSSTFVEDWLKGFKPGQPLATGLMGSTTAKSAVYMERNGLAHYAGASGPIRELSRVATLEDTELRSCLGKVEYRTKVTVYDAKSGQKRAEKSFDAPKTPCATIVATMNGKVLTDHYYADSDTVDAFVLAN